jgi:nitroreductase
LERGQDSIHAVRAFEIWHALAAVKDFKRRIVFAMSFRVKYFHSEIILLATICTGGNMEVFDVIHKRHSQGKVKPGPLPKEMIEKLLDAGNQAPNHFKVRPWRFVVLTGDARKKLGDVMAASQAERQPDLPHEAFDKIRGLPLRAPVLIAVGVDKPVEPKVLEIENISAASAACQNILLAAEAEELGAIWRTGEWARDAKVKVFLGFESDQHIIGFIYVGYPEFAPEPTPRPSFEDRTIWME